MKINDAVYRFGETGSSYIRKLMDCGLCCSCIPKASVVIVQEDGINKIIKDRWYDPYKSDEENLREIYRKGFHIISLQLLNRVTRNTMRPTDDFIMPGDNLIIVV